MAPEGSAEDIGRILRAAREHLGWSIEHAGAATAIPAVYVDALEHGRLDLLPGPVYTRGYVRTYATALHLDGDEFTDALTRLQPQGRFDALGSAARRPRRTGGSHLAGRLARIGLGALGLLLLLLLLDALWATIGPGDDSAPVDRPVTRATPGEPAPAPAQPQQPTPQVAAATPLSPASSDTEGAVYSVGRDAFTVTVQPTGRSWLQVRSGEEGEVLYEGTLEPGETKALPATAGLWMRIGDQSVVAVRIDDTPLVLPGESGQPYNVAVRK